MLHHAAGRPLLIHVLDAAAPLPLDATVIVSSGRQDEIAKTLAIETEVIIVPEAQPVAPTQIENVLVRDPAITHCGDPRCARCNDAVQGGPIIPNA